MGRDGDDVRVCQSAAFIIEISKTVSLGRVVVCTKIPNGAENMATNSNAPSFDPFHQQQQQVSSSKNLGRGETDKNQGLCYVFTTLLQELSIARGKQESLVWIQPIFTRVSIVRERLLNENDPVRQLPIFLEFFLGEGDSGQRYVSQCGVLGLTISLFY